MRKDLNLEQQEEDYKEARENELQKIAESNNVSIKEAGQIREDLLNSAEE
ncbi:hypothetical protein [Acinetobacter beijerinckii]|uniref:Uncharacterized protein n=1 Tax=Acinetobacter beijerinckii CIP 110307 TaxID=1217648 RepID=N9E8G7_9GAMM|nr:hypothetical protein [Acinetobacter beijerinckii]ENW06748.1 hypothetical protein F933_01199 [Acinetobacter beijerinckii CIP 110307]